MLGNLEEVTDADDNTTVMSYDVLGRKQTMDDPDMGHWEYDYDVAGNLVRQEDANGDVLCFYYDNLNRLVRKFQDETPADACPALSNIPKGGSYHRASYTYDTATNGVGLVASISWGPSPNENYETFTYDDQGRLTAQTRWIDGRAYTQSTLSFDAMNRPLSVQYPDGEIVAMTYDLAGADSLTAGEEDLVSAITYNERGQMTLLDRGALGATIPDTTYSYYPAVDAPGGGDGDSLFRLDTILHGNNNDDLPDFTYEYDLVGNIKKISSGSDVQDFVYDELDRLLQATGTAPTYTDDYTYDEIGNIDTHNGWQYEYDPNHPHAVQRTTWPIFPPIIETYVYDNNGNMIERHDDSGNYTQVFDVENRLEAVIDDDTGDSTTFVYDAAGQRVKTEHPDSRIIYTPFPNYEEEIRQLPTVQLTAAVTSVFPQETITLSWNSDNATTCQASGPAGWSGALPTQGTTDVSPPGGGWTVDSGVLFTLTCSNVAGTASDATSVSVLDPLPTPTNLTAIYDEFEDPSHNPGVGTRAPAPVAFVRLDWDSLAVPPGTVFEIYRSDLLPVPLLPTFLIGQAPVTIYDDLDGRPGDFYVVRVANAYGVSAVSDPAEAFDCRINPCLPTGSGTSANPSANPLSLVANQFIPSQRTATLLGEAQPDALSRMEPAAHSAQGVQTNGEVTMGEVGLLNNTLTSSPRTVVLNHSYSNPVVFAQPLSRNHGDTSVVRITDVQNDRFTLYVDEAPNKNGSHVAEAVSYLVLEAGVWELADGTLLQVGQVSTDATVSAPPYSWETVPFTIPFLQAPVVFSQVQSESDRDWVKTRQDGVTATQFKVGLEAEEVKNTAHGTESIGWLAMTPGSGSWSGHLYEASNTANAVTHNWYTISFGQSFTQAPRFLAGLATYDGVDPAHLRYKRTSLTSNGVQVLVEEDTTADPETTHTSEVVSYLALQGNGDLTATRAQVVIHRSTYSLAGQTIAVRVSGDSDSANNGLHYVYSDHLGSASAILKSGTSTPIVTKYLPFGDYRTNSGANPITDRGFTGHRHNDSLGLIYMNARFYVPGIGRFASADTIVPDPTNPQQYNRYSYVLNSPLNFIDPTGHICAEVGGNTICSHDNDDPDDIGVWLPPPPRNPWPTDKREENGHVNLTPAEILFEFFVMPANSDFNGFGGAMTSTNCDVPNRPPCDARHPGVDSITGVANEGDPIYAVAYGEVVRASIHPNGAFDGQGRAGGFGHYVLIEHNIYGTPLYSVYAHNSTVLVEEGDIVGPGDKIATMGNSATTVVHLHFEIRQANNIDWQAENPFRSQTYWPATVTELAVNFVDLGTVFGYSPTYAGWAEANP